MGNRTLTNKDECLDSKLRFSCFSTFCEFFFFPFLIICCCCVSNFIIVSQSLHIHAVMISGSHKCRIFTKNVIIYYILCIKQNLSGLYKKKSTIGVWMNRFCTCRFFHACDHVLFNGKKEDVAIYTFTPLFSYLVTRIHNLTIGFGGCLLSKQSLADSIREFKICRNR